MKVCPVKHTVPLLFLLLVLPLAGGVQAAEHSAAPVQGDAAPELSYDVNRTSMSVYFGLLTPQAFTELYAGPEEFVDATILAMSLTQELFSVGHLLNVRRLRPLKLEIEGFSAVHWGTWDHEHTFMEFGVSLNIRWHRFPWNKYVLTTAGFGEGVSIATEKPCYEARINNKTSHFLNFLMFDMTFALPDYPNLALLLRLHHRSGIFGLIDDVKGGSDFFTVGLKYTF